MTNRPTGPGTGIFTIFFREAGLFYEQAWQWANERASESGKYVEERARETGKYLEERARESGKYVEERTRESGKYLDDQAKADRLLSAEDDKRRLVEAQYRQTEAEARLLEQIRLAKEAGLDVDAILKRIREELR